MPLALSATINMGCKKRPTDSTLPYVLLQRAVSFGAAMASGSFVRPQPEKRIIVNSIEAPSQSCLFEAFGYCLEIRRIGRQLEPVFVRYGASLRSPDFSKRIVMRFVQIHGFEQHATGDELGDVRIDTRHAHDLGDGIRREREQGRTIHLDGVSDGVFKSIGCSLRVVMLVPLFVSPYDSFEKLQQQAHEVILLEHAISLRVL